MKSTLNTIFKVLMWVLVVVSVGILVFGFVNDFEKPLGEASDLSTVDILFYWTYFMLAVTLFATLIVGLVVNTVVNPKSLISVVAVIAGVAVICAAVYAVAPGNALLDFNGEELPTPQVLKLTDTILYLTYLAAGATVLSVVVAEIVMAIRNKI